VAVDPRAHKGPRLFRSRTPRILRCATRELIAGNPAIPALRPLTPPSYGRAGMDMTLDPGPLRGFGEMGARLNATDWTTTPVGATSAWPSHLRTAVGLCLCSRLPMAVWWGRPQYTMFYNDAYVPVLGPARHPRWFGASGKECWSDVWPQVGPFIDGVFDTGEPALIEDMPFVLERELLREEAYFTVAYGPIHAPDGLVAGVFAASAETTGRVVGDQRLALLHALEGRTLGGRTPDEACTRAAQVLSKHATAVPFALLYLRNGDPGARLAAATVAVDPELAPAHVDPDAANAVWPFAQAALTGRPVTVDLGDRGPTIADARWPDRCRSAVVLPLRLPGDAEPAGFLVAGAYPHRKLDTQYLAFLDLLADNVATSIGHARSEATVMEERERRLALEGFLATLAHELRSALQALGMASTMVRRGVAATHAMQVLDRQIAHTRVLVDDLLDASRVAHGKIELQWEILDLRDVVQVALEQMQVALLRGQVALGVDLPIERLEVHGDRVRLAQVLVNLLDNAMKYTPANGRVDVVAERSGAAILVRVRDTGQGIPANVLPHIFDLFVQARQGAGGGLGIGLALGAQLAQLHGGTLDAQSDGLDRGSEFTLTLPAAL
jgi:signal transduction histidine kinase